MLFRDYFSFYHLLLKTIYLPVSVRCRLQEIENQQYERESNQINLIL